MLCNPQFIPPPIEVGDFLLTACVKALKYAVEDVLLLCNGDISKCLYTRKKI